ncbi:MAG: hypothetical protein WDW36_008476 [Sanguina aurantia]
MHSDALRDSEIIDAWHANAAPWTVAVRAGDIASRRLVTDAAIIDAVLARAPRTVLDVGCGEGWLARALACRDIDVTGIDVVQALIDQARARRAVASSWSARTKRSSLAKTTSASTLSPHVADASWDPEGYSLAQSSGLPPTAATSSDTPHAHSLAHRHSEPISHSAHPSTTDPVAPTPTNNNAAHVHTTTRTAAAHLASFLATSSAAALAAAPGGGSSAVPASATPPQRFSLDESEFPALNMGGSGSGTGAGGKRGSSSSSTPNFSATGQSTRSLASSPMSSAIFPTGTAAHIPRLSLGASAAPAAATASLSSEAGTAASTMVGHAQSHTGHPTPMMSHNVHHHHHHHAPASSNGSGPSSAAAASNAATASLMTSSASSLHSTSPRVGPGHAVSRTTTGFASAAAAAPPSSGGPSSSAATAGWARPAGPHSASVVVGGVSSGFNTLSAPAAAAGGAIGGVSGSRAAQAAAMLDREQQPGSGRSRQQQQQQQQQVDRKEAPKTRKGG